MFRKIIKQTWKCQEPSCLYVFFFFWLKLKCTALKINQRHLFIQRKKHREREDAKQNRRSNLNQRGKEEKGWYCLLYMSPVYQNYSNKCHSLLSFHRRNYNRNRNKVEIVIRQLINIPLKYTILADISQCCRDQFNHWTNMALRN